MRTRRLGWLWLLGVAAALAAAPPAATRPKGFGLLTASLGEAGSSAAAINDKGVATGDSSTGEDHWVAFRWAKGAMRPLELPDGAMDSFGTAVSDSGLIAGAATFEGDGEGRVEPFVWARKSIWTIGTLGGQSAVAYGVNDRGEVVGGSETAPTDMDGAPAFGAFHWRNGKISALPTLGGPYSSARAINSRGLIAGLAMQPDGETFACTWRKGKISTLPGLGGRWSTAVAVNERGLIAGSSEITPNGEVHACVWDKGQVIDLGTLGGSRSVAQGINDRGQVVGWSTVLVPGEGGMVEEPRAFLWEKGRMTDLNSLFPIEMDTVLTDARGINNRGEVVGAARERDDLEHYVAFWLLRG